MRTRAVQSVHQRKTSTLGSDVFLLDVVPPSPYHTADVLHTRSRSSDAHDSRHNDGDVVLRSPPPQPGLLRDLGHAAAPSLPARRPMTPQSSPPPPPSSTSNMLTGEVCYNGVTNAAFTHPDPTRVEPTMAASSRRVASVRRPSSGPRTPQSASVYTAAASSNSLGRSPVIPLRRGVDVDDGRRSAAAGAVRSRAREDEYVHSHPVPPPADSSLPAAVHQTRPALVNGTVTHPTGLCGPLSLSTGVLNFSPPAPHLTRGQVRYHLRSTVFASQPRMTLIV